MSRQRRAATECDAIVAAEIGNRFEIRLELTGQPDQFEIARTLPLEPARRLHLIEIAVEVDLQHCRRMVPRTARHFRLNMEAECAKIHNADKGIDGSHSIVAADIVIDACR